MHLVITLSVTILLTVGLQVAKHDRDRVLANEEIVAPRSGTGIRRDQTTRSVDDNFSFSSCHVSAETFPDADLDQPDNENAKVPRAVPHQTEREEEDDEQDLHLADEIVKLFVFLLLTHCPLRDQP